MGFSEINSAPQHHNWSKKSTFSGSLRSVYVYVTHMGHLGALLGAWSETRASLLITEMSINNTSRQNYNESTKNGI